MGKLFVEDRYVHRNIGSGKPPLSGWDREKRRRAQEKLLNPQQLKAG